MKMKIIAYSLLVLFMAFIVLFVIAICTVSQLLSTISLLPLILAMAIAFEVKDKIKE